MYQKPQEVDQSLQRGSMNVFLTRNVLKAVASRPGASRGCLSIFLIRYVFLLSKLKEADQELQRGYVNVSLMRYVLDVETNQEH